MDEKAKAAFEAIFKRHEDTKSKGLKAQEERGKEEDQSLARFDALRESTIKPAMKAVGEYVESKGLSYRIVEKEDSRDTEGRDHPASIAFVFLVGGDTYRPVHEYPSLTLFCEKRTGKVRLHQSTMVPGSGGQAGPVGEILIEEMTEEMIQQRLAGIANEVFL